MRVINFGHILIFGASLELNLILQFFLLDVVFQGDDFGGITTWSFKEGVLSDEKHLLEGSQNKIGAYARVSAHENSTVAAIASHQKPLVY